MSQYRSLTVAARLAFACLYPSRDRQCAFNSCAKGAIFGINRNSTACSNFPATSGVLKVENCLQREKNFNPMPDQLEWFVWLHNNNLYIGYANKSRPLGSGIGRASSLAVSSHSAITISTLASASCRVVPSAAQPASSGTSAMNAPSSSLQ